MKESKKISLSFSRVDNGLLEEILKEEEIEIVNSTTGEVNFFELLNKLIEVKIKKKLEESNFVTNPDVKKSCYNFAKYKEYCMHFFCVGNQVTWKSFLLDLYEKSNYKLNEFSNQNDLMATRFPSFIITKEIERDIYLITAGQGNSIVNSIRDLYFGIDVLSKIIKKSDPIIKNLCDKKLSGKRNTEKFYNRSTSSFDFEQDFFAVYTNLGVELKGKLIELIGITEDKADKNLSVLFGSQIDIGKSLTIDEIDYILKTVTKLKEKEHKFVVNFLVPVDRKGIKQASVFDEYYEMIDNNPNEIEMYNNVLLNHQISKYRFEKALKSERIIIDENYKFTDIDSLDDLREKIVLFIKENKKSKNILCNYKIRRDYISENEEDLSIEYKIRDLLEAEICYNGKFVYLREGRWYILVENYLIYLENEFKSFLNSSKNFCEKLYSNILDFPNIKSCKTEEGLKELIKGNHLLIDADTKLMNGVEIADAIYIDNNNTYIFHNKTNFNRAGVSSVLSQILTSCEYINKTQQDYKNEEENPFNKYIEKLKSKNTNKVENIENFRSNVIERKGKIIYIANFTDEVSIDTKSNYVKYLLYNAKKHLQSYNYNLYFY